MITFIIIGMTFFMLLLLWGNKQTKRIAQEHVSWKQFIEQMAKEGRVVDEKGNCLYEIDVENVSGASGQLNLSKKLKLLHDDSQTIIRITSGKMIFERKPMEIHVRITKSNSCEE